MTYNTKRREEIIEYFKSRADESHSLKEVLSALTTGGEGESSVYRIVASLCESGILRKLNDPKSRHCKYQFVGGESCHRHLHLKCTSCGRLIHLDSEKSKKLKESILVLGDFNLDESAFLFGECLACSARG